MNNAITVSVMLIFLWIPCKSQDSIYVVHKLVGDTIDKTEKLTYHLFPELKDSLFDYCYIVKKNGGYALQIRYQNDSNLVRKLDTNSFHEYWSNISKISEYHLYQAGKDSLMTIEKKLSLHDLRSIDASPSPVISLINPSMKKDIYNDSKARARLANDLQRIKQKEHGTNISNMYIILYDPRYNRK